MRVQSRVLICKIRVRNVVILVSQINGGAVAGGKKLNTTSKLRSEVELLRGSKHSMVEVQEAAAAREKGFDVAIVNEVYLRTDRAAANAVRIRSSASKHSGASETVDPKTANVHLTIPVVAANNPKH